MQQAQLSALQSLLLDARIESNLKPTGMPVKGYISSYFGERPDPFDGHMARHTGLDIAAPSGTSVHAVAEGMVTFTGVRHGYGNVVEIDHGNGYMTRFAHNSAILVHPGEHVQVGQVISRVGSTGRSTGPHLHFEVWYHGRVVNPLAFVRNHR
jgi:murein DD-endopeptidase MepM/ murein hydrolase activator NlpD